MATAVSVSLEPIPETFTPHVDEILARAADPLPAFEGCYRAFLDIEKKRFADEGPGWEGLAASTQVERQRLGIGGAHPILDRTGAPDGGALKASLTDQGHPDAVFEPELDGVFMGTSDPVARYHQDGTDRMPARQVVDMTEVEAGIFAGIIGEYLFEGVKATAVTGGVLFAAGAVGL